jgi:hypothetical protein
VSVSGKNLFVKIFFSEKVSRLVRTVPWIAGFVFVVILGLYRPLVGLAAQWLDPSAGEIHVYPWGIVSALAAAAIVAAGLTFARRK